MTMDEHHQIMENQKNLAVALHFLLIEVKDMKERMSGPQWERDALNEKLDKSLAALKAVKGGK